MLIFNGLLLMVVACSSSSNILVVGTGGRWRRDSITESTGWPVKSSEGKRLVVSHIGGSASDASPAATTVHTNPTADPSSASTYSPYHRKGPNDSPELAYRQTTPSLQGGFQPGQTSANRPQTNPPYPGNLQNQSPQKSQYFSNPSSYRVYSEPGKHQLRNSPFPNGGFPSFPKFKSSSKYPGIASNDYSFGSPPKFRFVTGPSFNGQSTSLIGSSQRFGAPHYKTSPQSISKNLGSSSGSLQSNSEAASFVKALESEPIILSTGLDYQTYPSSSGFQGYQKLQSGPSLKDHRTGPFESNIANYQPYVVPGHSTRTSPKIPQYQTGNVNPQPDDYQQLVNQPQLHFTTGAPSQSGGTFRPIYHTNPLDKIRTDVELIDKKTTTTPSPFGSDENDFDQVFKTAGSDFPYLGVDGGSSQSLKTLSHQNSFELPNSNLFNSYDQAFGKYSKLASLERENIPKFNPSPVDDTPKPVRQNVKENDEDEDDTSSEYRSTSEGRDSTSSYEEDDEEESRTNQNQESSDDKQDDDDDYELGSYKGYDFGKEFEDSYRKDLPKSDYVHVKEVPEVEESSTESRRQRPAKRISRLASKQTTRHVTRGNEKLKNTDDNEGHGSRSSYKRAKSNEPRIEDSFGYKIPLDRGTKRLATIDDEDKSSTSFSDSFSTSTLTPIADLQSYSFPAFDDWKSTTKLPTSNQDTRAFFDSENSSKLFPQGHRGSSTFTFEGQDARDFTSV